MIEFEMTSELSAIANQAVEDLINIRRVEQMLIDLDYSE